MNMWAKMLTAIKGGLNDAGESLADHQALRILDQEMRDAQAELHQNRARLVEMMANQKTADAGLVMLQKQVQDHEGYALKALEQGDESLALEVAEKIASLSDRVKEAKASLAASESLVQRMQQAVQAAEVNLQRIRQQVDTVRANQSVLRAQQAIAQRYSGQDSKLTSALDTLERIRTRQAHEEAQLNAAKELAAKDREDPLEKKLKQAGIIGTGQRAVEILEQLKNQK